VKVSDGILVAVISLASASAASWLTGKAAVDAARAQADASLSATQAQLRNSAALKLFELRSTPLAEIYTAQSKLKTAAWGKEMSTAAQQLAVAAASAAARLDGKAAILSLQISERAAALANLPESMSPEIVKTGGDLAVDITNLTFEYQKSQKNSLKVIFSEKEEIEMLEK